MKALLKSVIAASILLGGCNFAQGGGVGAAAPQAWIDQPLEGSQFLLGDTIPIQWHATGDDGVRRIDVRVNGEVIDTADTQDGDFDAYAFLVQGQVDWMPELAGEYLIQVEPTGPDDVVGTAAENRVHVYAEGGTIAGMVATDFNLDGDAQDEGEGPLEGASVIVVYCGDKLSMRTDERGRFEFTNVPIGICTISAEKPGWFFAGTHPADLDVPIHVWSDPEAAKFTDHLPVSGGHPHADGDADGHAPDRHGRPAAETAGHLDPDRSPPPTRSLRPSRPSSGPAAARFSAAWTASSCAGRPSRTPVGSMSTRCELYESHDNGGVLGRRRLVEPGSVHAARRQQPDRLRFALSMEGARPRQRRQYQRLGYRGLRGRDRLGGPGRVQGPGPRIDR